MIGLQFVLLVSWWFSCSYGFQPRGQKLLQTRNRLHSIFNPFGKFASSVKPEKADSDTWRNGYANTNEEVCDVLVGTVPGDLVGTYYRNVHGKYQIGRDEIAHPFDADGMVTAITFQNGTCFFRNRFVRTEGFLRERKANRILHRGAFGTQIPGGWLANFMRTKLKNVANTNVIYFANKLLALWEAGGPYALDADTLHTVGKFRFNGALQDDEPFTAHPKIDPFSGHLVGFNYQPGPHKTDLRIMEFASNMSLLHDRTIEIPGFSFFHDMAITRKHALFVQGSFDFNPLPFVLGFKSPAACMTFNKKGKSKLHIVSRTSSARRIVELDSHFNFHVANAFERANGDIVIDVIGASDMLMMKQNAAREPLWRSLQWNELPLASLQRYVIHTDNSFEKTPLFPHPFEMPVVPASLVGQDVRFVYGISTRGELKKPGPFQSLVKIDTTNGRYDQYDLPTDEFLGEPAFAPKMRPKGKYHAKGPEDDGYLLVMTLNGRTKTSALLVFDAQNIRQGPIQRFALPTFVSYGLHGSFVPNLTFPYANVLQKFSAFSALDGHV